MSVQADKTGVIERLKNAFLRHRRRLVPFAVIPPKSEHLFDIIAARCQQYNVTPEDYVEICWEFHQGDDFYVNTLLAKDFPVWLEKFQLARLGDLEGQYNAQMYYLKCVLDSGREIEDILYDPRYNFRPWFRVFAPLQPVPKIIEKYGEAVMDYLQVPKFVAFFKAKQFDVGRVK